MPKVIIMMSTYNGEKYLAEQIESILNQTEKDFVLEIHDDGSTDGTLEIIKAYAQKDKRICIDNSGHKGYPKCFFDLMKDAGEAKYYAFSDQDDVWLPNKIERAISFIDNEESPALYGAHKKIVDSNLNEIGRDSTQQPGVLYAFLCKNELSGCTMVYNRKLQDILLKYIPDRKDFYHDSWIYKVALVCGKVKKKKKATILYRQHNNNTVGATEKGIKRFIHSLEKFDFTFKKYRNHPYSNGYVKEILAGYSKIIPLEKIDVLETISNSNRFKCKIRLLKTDELRSLPFYLVIWKKVSIILGWI